MAFAFTTAVAGAGTVSCTGTTTVTGTGTTFATLTGSAAGANHARVGGTITVGGVTKTIIAIASTTSLTVDTAFGTFTNQAFTVATGVTQTGTDKMDLNLGVITGFNVTNRGDLLRTFDCRGVDLFINGTLTVDSTVAQLRNDGSCNNSITINGSASGGELIINGRKSVANNGPFPYPGFDWLGTNGLKIMKLASTNATYPAKFTLFAACVRYGADWITTYLNNYSKITTQGDTCWILCGKGTGTSQARLRQDNTTASIDFQATKTYVGVWLNFGVPQISLKGYAPINTDGPEVNLGAVSVATRIPIENYDTTYVTPAYYAGVQFVMLGGGWTRLKNNLLGTNIAWRAASASNRNVLEFSKQIKAISKDSLGNVLNDGYLYFQPVGTNVAGIRARGGTSDITFDLSQQNILVSGGFAETEFVYAWDYKNVDGNYNIYSYFCSGTTKGAETHPAFLSRYGYDKQPITMALSGNNTFEATAFHTSLPTTDKVIANAQAITGVSFNFGTKVMTISGNLTYQQIYDAYQYALNQTANLFQADNCLITNSTSNYVGWTINVNTGVTLTNGGNFEVLQANTITLNGTAKIQGVYKTIAGTSTVLTISGFANNSSVYVEDNNFDKKFYSASASGEVVVYIPPTATGIWYYAVEKYGNQRQSDFFTFSGGQKSIVVKAIEDTGITNTNSATVGAYTSLETPDKIYDYVAFLRLSEPHISYGQIVFKDGKSLDLQNASMLVNQSASAVASFNYDTKLLTIKSLVLNTGVTFDKIIAIPPATITANTNEQINVLIEDANGNSSLTLLGGDNLGYKLWKVPSSSPVDVDPTTGVLLATLANNTSAFRFIGISGFDIIGIDLSSGVKRRTSMGKGVYTQSFYVGDQIQLSTDAPQLVKNNQKLDELILKIDTDLDVKVSTRLAADDYVEPATAQSVWGYETRTLTSAGAAGATLAEIEASNILAKEATSQSIKNKVDSLNNYNDAALVAKVDAIKIVADSIKTTVEDKTGYALTESQINQIAYTVESHLLNEGDSQQLINAIVGAIGNTNIDETVLVAAIRADLERAGGKIDSTAAKVDTLENANFTDTNALIIDLGSPLQSEDYVAPDNTGIASVKAKVDAIPANPVLANDARLDKLDANVSSRSTLTVQDIPAGLTVAEIEASMVLAKENTSQAIKNKVATLVNADLSGLPTLEQIEASTVLAKESSIQELATATTPATIKEELLPALTVINEGVKKASRIKPHKQNLPE